MEKRLLMPLNLQFFAEGEDSEGVENESENTSEVAEQTEEQGEDTQDTDETEEESASQPWKNQQNAGFAAARRQAEAEIRARDARYAQRFKGYTNPMTGAEIRSEADYFAALDAQEELNRRNSLMERGIDANELDELIANNPVIKQAQQILAKSQEQEYVRQFGAELDEIKGMDASIKSIEDVLNSPQKSAILQKINAGYSLVDAYKLCNFDRLTAANAQAGKQAAINSLRSKNHMTQTGGVTDTTTDMEIPTAELNRWKEMFPDATDKELRAKYTRATRALG